MAIIPKNLRASTLGRAMNDCSSDFEQAVIFHNMLWLVLEILVLVGTFYRNLKIPMKKPMDTIMPFYVDFPFYHLPDYVVIMKPVSFHLHPCTQLQHLPIDSNHDQMYFLNFHISQCSRPPISISVPQFPLRLARTPVSNIYAFSTLNTHIKFTSSILSDQKALLHVATLISLSFLSLSFICIFCLYSPICIYRKVKRREQNLH